MPEKDIYTGLPTPKKGGPGCSPGWTFNRKCFVEHADLWREIVIEVPTLLVPVTGAPIVRVRRAPGDTRTIAKGEHWPDRNGYVWLPEPGCWYLNLPLAGQSAARVCFRFTPVTDKYLLPFFMAAFGVTTPFDLTRIGGTAQTGVDYFGRWVSLTPGSPNTAAPGVASAEAIGALSTRKKIYIKNTSTAGQRVSLGLGVAATLDSGITLDVGEAVTFSDIEDPGVAAGQINAIASAASARLSYQPWS